MIERLKKSYSLDLRALALLRIGIALVLIADLSIRLLDLSTFYTAEGVMPFSLVRMYHWNSFEFSLYAYSDTKAYVLFLFCLNYIAALMLLFGYRTRLATILCWIFLFSLQHRNPMILQAGDDLLRLLLFWGIFLPWHYRYSIDADRKAFPNAQSYFSPAAVAYIVQIFSIYFFTGLLKNHPEWTKDGTALYYALSLDQIVYPVGKLIYPYPGLLKFLTISVFYMEVILPLVLLIPFFVPRWRRLFICIIFLFQMGIGLTMNVGLFFIINIVSLIGLIPGKEMDGLDRKLKIIRTKGQGLIEEQSFPKNSLIIFLVIYGFTWNLGTLPAVGYALDDRSNWIGYSLRLDQNWAMFAPSVFKDDGWFIFEAQKSDGSWIDIKNEGKAINYTKPENIYKLYGRDRWRKYYENFLFVFNDWMRGPFCEYTFKQWNQSHPEMKVRKLLIVYMKEVTAPDYKYVKPKREILCSCGD